MLDYLNNRRALATGLTQLGVTIGALAATLTFVFSDMAEDAEYDDNGKTRWQNNMRIIEVPCLPAYLPAYLPVCIYACMPVCLAVCIHGCIPVCLDVCIHACMPVCIHACICILT